MIDATISHYRIVGKPAGMGFPADGDIVRFGGDGYLHILDRKRDMIISGGIMSSPPISKMPGAGQVDDCTH